MANTYNAGLVSEFLHDAAITTLGPTYAPFAAFATNFSSASLSKPKDTLNIELVTAGSTTLTDPDNYESGDSTVGLVSIQPTVYSQPFTMENSNMQKGGDAKRLLLKNLQVLRNKIQDDIFASIDEATFGARVVDKAAASFTADDLPTLWEAAGDFLMKHLVLDTAYYAKVLPTTKESFRPEETGAYGFDRILHTSRWDGAEAGTRGFVCDPNSFGIVTAIPYKDPAIAADLTESEIIEIDTGFALEHNVWVSRTNRKVWHSLDVAVGSASADTSAMALLGDTTTPAA